MRLAIVATHPVQYYAPWFRHLADKLDIEVLYAHRQTGKSQADAGFGVSFDWDRPLLEGYPYRWLKNVARSPGVDSFASCDTPELSEILKSGAYDACLILGWNRKCFIQAAMACQRLGLNLLVRGDSQLITPRGRLRRLIKYVPYRLLLPRCSAHLYVGQRNREYLEHYGVPASKLHFSPHCVDNSFFSTGAKTATNTGLATQLRAELGIQPTDFVALFVGKFIALKRPQDLISACQLTDMMPLGGRIHAVFVGDGPLRDMLKQQADPIQQRIHFAGFRNQSELPLWYAMSDTLVLSSERETWGLVVNEALACGKPAVVSEDVGCAPDLIDSGKTGYTFRTGNVSSLVDRLRDVSVATHQRGTEIRQAIAQKMQVYSYERAAAGLLEGIRSLMTADSHSAMALK